MMKLLGTIGKTPFSSKDLWRIKQAIGRILPTDLNKRVYDNDGVIQVENNEQRDKRLETERNRWR